MVIHTLQNSRDHIPRVNDISILAYGKYNKPCVSCKNHIKTYKNDVKRTGWSLGDQNNFN